MRLATYTALLALLAACSSDKVAGTGSQTGNSVVAGRLLRSDATNPDTGHPVMLAPASWTGDSVGTQPRLAHTDSLGRYRFGDVPPGVWYLEARTSRSGWSRSIRVTAGRDTTLPDAVPTAFGTLIVEVQLNDVIKRGRMYVLGYDTSYPLMTPAKTIFVTLGDLCAGKRTLVVRSATGAFLQQAIVTVRSGATDSIDASVWKTTETAPYPDLPDD